MTRFDFGFGIGVAVVLSNPLLIAAMAGANVAMCVGDPYWNVRRHGMKGKMKHEVVFIRHCESTGNEAGMLGDVFVDQDRDVALTSKGKEQAKYVKKVIRSLQPCEVLSSPLQRTMDTAGCTVQTVRHVLREKNLKGTHRLNRFLESVSAKETEEEFQKRVARFVQECRAVAVTAKSRTRTVAVTHSLWIQEFIRQVTGGGSGNYHNGNGSVTVAQFTENAGEMHVELVMLGSVDHIPHELRSGHHHALYYYASSSVASEKETEDA
jgi:broad specificity phosphatase PhoE